MRFPLSPTLRLLCAVTVIGGAVETTNSYGQVLSEESSTTEDDPDNANQDTPPNGRAVIGNRAGVSIQATGVLKKLTSQAGTTDLANLRRSSGRFTARQPGDPSFGVQLEAPLPTERTAKRRLKGNKPLMEDFKKLADLLLRFFSARTVE